MFKYIELFHMKTSGEMIISYMCFLLEDNNIIHICSKLICSCAKILVPLPTKNRNAETTINVIAGARARIALDSY